MTPASRRQLLLPLAAAAALALACWATAALWAWQAHRQSGEIEFGGFHLPSRGQTDYLRSMDEYVRLQTVHDGAANLSHFATLLFNDEESPSCHLTRLETRALVPMDSWVDLVARRTERARLVFRLSRCLDIPSGWYVFRRDRCVLQRAVDTSAIAPPGTVADPRWRSDLKNYSFMYPNQSRALVNRESHSQWVDLALTMDPTSFEAWIGNRRVGGLDLTANIDPGHPGLTADQPSLEMMSAGACGVSSGDLPPIRVDRMAVSGLRAGGAPLRVEATFDLPPWSSQRWSDEIATRAWWFMAVVVFLTLLLIWLFPDFGSPRNGVAGGWGWGFGSTRMIVWGVAALGVVSLMTLWIEWRRLINFGASLDSWRTGMWTALGAVYFVMALRGRRQFRFRSLGSESKPLRPAVAWLWTFLMLAAVAALAGSWWHLRVRAPGAWQQISLPAGESRSWSPEQPLHEPLIPVGQAAVDLAAQWEVTLDHPSSVLEIYFNRWDEPPAGLPRWLALRLTPGGIGFIPSEGFEPPLRGPGLTIGQPHFVDVRLQRGRLSAEVHAGSATGPVVANAATRSPWREAGAAGLVGRAGAGSARFLGASVGEIPREEIAKRSLRLTAANWPAWLFVAAGSLAMALSLGLGILTAAIGRAPGRSAFGWSLAVGLLGAALGIWLASLENSVDLERAGWLASAVLWAPALAVLALWYFFWIANFQGLRGRQVVSLLFLVGLFASGEALARSGPCRFLWQTRTKPGYVLRDFLFADASAGLVWNDYTREVNYYGEPCAPAPASGEHRVFCLGGSSTWGAGVGSMELTFPALLERRLRERTGDQGWNVLNAGWPTYTVNDDLLRWRRDVRQRRPEWLVLYIGGNDQIGTNRPAVRQRQVRALIESLAQPTLVNRMQLWMFNLRLLVGARSALGALRGGQIHQFVCNTPPEDFEATLRELLAEARADGVKVALAPEILVECLTEEDHVLRPYDAVMARLAEEYGCTLIDTVGAFRARRLDALMTDYIHPNVLGNEILADLMSQAILASEEATPLNR